MKGKKLSVYLSDDMARLAQDMADGYGTSLSDVIGRAVYEAAAMNHADVRISEGAYVCMAAGRLDLVQSMRMENGTMMILMKEEAYRKPDGTMGDFAFAKDELMAYLGGKPAAVEVRLQSWHYVVEDHDAPVHLGYEDGSGIRVPKSEFDRAFGCIVQQPKDVVIEQFKGEPV